MRVTLVPDHHICVVPRSTVVELVPQSVERITYTPPRDYDFRSVCTTSDRLIRVEWRTAPVPLDVIYDA